MRIIHFDFYKHIFQASSTCKNEATNGETCQKSNNSSGLYQLQKYIKWLVLGVAVGGGTIYLYNIAVPDWRELRDRKHYYSDWKVCLLWAQYVISMVHTKILWAQQW